MRKSPEYRIWQVLMQATSKGSVPMGYYGPGTCRWATPEEMRELGVSDRPLVHVSLMTGKIDCYFTETKAVVVMPLH
jgi:hypothetical protein